MEFSITVDDVDVDSLARRLGWTKMIQDPNHFGQQISNTVDQETHIANAAKKYLGEELKAAVAVSAAEAARQAALTTAQQSVDKIITVVTNKSKLPPS